MEKAVQIIIEAIQELTKGKDMGEVSKDSKLFEDLNMDSVTIIELLVSLEFRFEGFEARPEDMVPENFETLEKLAEYITSSLSVSQQ